ncbi:hypothetical protein ACFLTA_00520 [Bacteroidota bacterium]
MNEIVKESSTGTGIVQLYRNGIMHQTYQDGSELTMEDSQRELEVYRAEFCVDTNRPILVDINNIKTVSKESRSIYSSEKTAEVFSAAALLVGNPVSRIIGNFYLGINKSAMPIKMFTNSDEALAWLKTFLPE